MKETENRLFRLLLLGFCLVFFVSSATTDLALPGPQDDEMVYACLALDMMHPPHPFGTYHLHLGHQPFPFGVDRHTGALRAYLLWPLFVLFGPSVPLVRFSAVCLGLLTLLFFYLFSRDLFGFWTSFLGLLFLSLDSAFIFYSKLDAGPIIEQLLWMGTYLWGFSQWARTQKFFYLFLLLLSALLGIYSHIAFIWFLIAHFLAGLLFYRDTLRRLGRRPFVYFSVPAFFCSLIIFLYWLKGDKRLLFLEPPGFSGIFVMFERLSTQGGILTDVLMGRSIKTLSSLGFKTRPLTDLFLAVSVLFLSVRSSQQPKAVKFLLVVSGIMFLELLVTPGDFVLYPHRMMPLYLFGILFGAVAVSESLNALRKVGKPIWQKTICLGILFLAVYSLWSQVLLKREADGRIRSTGGKGRWSDAVYGLSAEIERNGWTKVVCLDWSLDRPIFFLTEGRVPLFSAFWGIGIPRETKRRLLADVIEGAAPRTLFLLHLQRIWSDGFSVKEFSEIARQLEKVPNLKQVYYDGENVPIYAAYMLESR